ncbi:MAG: SpoIID/LytB domain-containing protein [Candidatus Kryptoniota bacterium]
MADSTPNHLFTTRDTFNFNGKTYPGNIELIPVKSDILIINLVGLETYLRGVVPNELVNNLTNDELQACMAQAVAARNYAIYKMSKTDTSNFDVYSDTRDQVYSGIEGYRSLADSAIRMTSGIIVEYNGTPARCFFHSTCGGQTEKVQNVWQGQPPLPYLQGIQDIDSTTGAPFCIDSPHFYWTESFSIDTLDNFMNKYLSVANPGYSNRIISDNIKDISILNRFQSFRVDSLQITTVDGKKYFIRGDRIRYFFRQDDGSLLRSNMFRIEAKKNKSGDLQELTLRGQGNGHGVGMCQWGAIGMSRKGFNYKEILYHYYPGTTIKKIY